MYRSKRSRPLFPSTSMRYRGCLLYTSSLPQTDDLDAKFRDLTQKRAKREADVYHSQYAQALADTQKQINEDVYKRQDQRPDAV